VNRAAYIAIAGPGTADNEAEELAFKAGSLLAKRGAVVVTGGLGGSMEAACRGAKKERGATIGILPGSSRDEANSFVDVAIATGMGEARNALIVRTVDALIAVGGGFGTLSEIAFALKLGKPVVGLGTWELRQMGAPVKGVVPAQTADEAVNLALEFVLGEDEFL
jgi:uncharacterized protein (TIGR00725 family)